MSKANSKRTKPLGCIYFIQGGDFVKIGWTGDSNPERRMAQLQTANPFRLRILGVVEHRTIDNERRIHARFSDIRAEGEWFQATTHLLRLIARYSTMPRSKVGI